MTKLNTTGKIAKMLGVPIHRVQYILRTRDIAPVATAAHYRLFDRAAVEQIAEALQVIDHYAALQILTRLYQEHLREVREKERKGVRNGQKPTALTTLG